MAHNNEDAIRKVTSQLSEEILLELMNREDVVFRPVPNASSSGPVWRVRFDLEFDSNVRMGLDINGEVMVGRGKDEPGFVALFDSYDTESLGLSRHHALLRPTETRLYILDLGSTNGTYLNGRSIGVNMPYGLADGDHIKMGRLQFTVRFIRRPGGLTAALRSHADLIDTLPAVARNIAAQLDFHEVLKAAMDMALAYTPADEITLWLVDEQTGELFLEAGRGTNDEHIARLPVKDTLAGRVLATGKPLRVNRTPTEERIKLKTGYLVGAVIYVPLTVGGVTFGVLSAANREQGRGFGEYDEKLLAAIGDFTAVAVQNARIHQTMRQTLRRYGKTITALRYLLSQDLKNRINAMIGYSGLLRSYDSVDTATLEIVDQIINSNDSTLRLVDCMVELAGLCEDLVIHPEPCDLVELTKQAVEDMQPRALEKHITLATQVLGTTYNLNADGGYLLRSIHSLIDNGIRFTPEGGTVSVALIYSPDDVIIRVSDTGPGLPPDLLPNLFDEYVRSAPAPDGKGGIGLGLEIVRATAQAHRGTVLARNIEGSGAEIVITLPGSLRAH